MARADGEFPVLDSLATGLASRHKLPWDWVQMFEGQYVKNHCGQSLDRLAERGGLSWQELWAGMKGINPFSRGGTTPDRESCKIQVLNAVAVWSAR